MSTNHTEHYQLCLWEEDDPVQRTDFNEDNEKIEKALVELETDKAEQTALEALSSQVTALETDRLVWKFDSYRGTNSAGPTGPNRLEFDFKPLLVLVGSPADANYGGCPWIRGMSIGRCYVGSGISSIYLTWEDRAVEWYTTTYNVSYQLNSSTAVYPYFVLGIEE